MFPIGSHVWTLGPYPVALCSKVVEPFGEIERGWRKCVTGGGVELLESNAASCLLSVSCVWVPWELPAICLCYPAFPAWCCVFPFLVVMEPHSRNCELKQTLSSSGCSCWDILSLQWENNLDHPLGCSVRPFVTNEKDLFLKIQVFWRNNWYSTFPFFWGTVMKYLW